MLLFFILFFGIANSVDNHHFTSYDFSTFSSKVYLDSANQTLSITQDDGKTNFAAFMGKGFLSIMPNFVGKNYSSNMTMKIETTENLQFFIYYTNFPPGAAPLIPSSVNWTYNFSSLSNFYQVFTLFTTSSSDSSGEMSTCAFFQRVVKLFLPKGGTNFMKQRLNNVNSSLGTLLGSNDDIATIQGHLGTISSYFNSITIEEGVQQAGTTQADPPSANVTVNFNLSNDNDLIYSYSDETSHFWLNSDKTSLFIVDAGSQLLATGLNNSIQNLTVQYVNIFVTHCHYDHIQSLATFIYKNYKTYNITVFVSSRVVFGLTGWMLENYPFITDGQGNFTFKMVIMPSNNTNIVNVPNTNLKVQAIQHNEFPKHDLKHFIPSTTWVFYEPNKCAKIFSGDLNPPSPKPNTTVLATDIQAYFEQVYQIVSGDQNCLDYFWDYGHFADPNENYNSTLQNFNRTDMKNQTLNSDLYYIHYKNTSGTAVYKVNLRTTNMVNATVYITPPEYNWTQTISGNNGHLMTVLGSVMVFLFGSLLFF